MHLEQTEDFRKSSKKLKNHYKEQEVLEKIKNHIKNCDNCDELIHNPVSNIYGLEKLKYGISGYFSFNLCKNGGVIRLIFSVNIHKNTVILEYISTNHYKDFDEKVKKIREMIR